MGVLIHQAGRVPSVGWSRALNSTFKRDSGLWMNRGQPREGWRTEDFLSGISNPRLQVTGARQKSLKLSRQKANCLQPKFKKQHCH